MPKGGGYKTISIPEEFYYQIESFIKDNREFGYTSVAEFVKEAIRLHLKTKQ